MQPTKQLSFVTLFLLISFASVNGVLFTPALPHIAQFFQVKIDEAQLLITLFLMGNMTGQLIYGPVANRYGRKPTLYAGISLQIISSLLCVLARPVHYYPLLVIGRFFLALGSGVGLKMTFTLVNETYPPAKAGQWMTYLLLAFAISPACSIAIGGVLNTHWGWTSCFYVGAAYGLFLFLLATALPETLTNPHLDALKFTHLSRSYARQFTNTQVLAGGILMGCVSSIVYVFSALGPFIAINVFHLTSSEYGSASMLQGVGLLLGSLISVQISNYYSVYRVIALGVSVSLVGVLFMLIALYENLNPLYALFLPMAVILFGLAFVNANASSIAMNASRDKAHASAVMNFMNMATASIFVLNLSFFPIRPLLLPSIYLSLCGIMLLILKFILVKKAN